MKKSSNSYTIIEISKVKNLERRIIMKIKQWMKVTYVEDRSNIRVDDDFYNKDKDDDKTIKHVTVQDDGVVVFHTK